MEFKEKPDIKFEFREGEEQTTLTRSATSELDKRKGNRDGTTRSVSQLLWWGFYTLLIVAGLFGGRWLSTRSQTAQPPATTAQNKPGQATVSSSGEIVTSSGFVCPSPKNELKTTSKELNMLVWTEYLPSDWFECFEATYGIKINRTEFSSNEEMLALLTDNSHNFDLIQPSDQSVATLISQGKLQKLDKSLLPVMSNFNPAFLNLPYDPGNDYTLPYQSGALALAVNSEHVTNEPTAWKDLWKPEYAGHILMMEDPRDTIAMTLLANGYSFNSTSEKELEAIKPQLRDLINATKVYNSDSQSGDILDGKIDVGFFWNGEAVLAQRKNPAIHYVYPTEGAILWQDNYAIWHDAQHSDAVYAWINYTMQADLFWMMLRDFPYTNPNQAALEFAQNNHPELYDEYINSTTTNIPAQVMLRGHWLDDLGEKQALYDKVWEEVNKAQ